MDNGKTTERKRELATETRQGKPTVTAEKVSPEASWLDYSTWSLSAKFFPVFVALVGVFIAVYYANFSKAQPVDMTSVESCSRTFNFTFRINAARHQAQNLSTRSWELGTTAEAVGELINPEKSVFGHDPFPNDQIPRQGSKADQALLYVKKSIEEHSATLFADEFSATGPASLGIAAVMLAQRETWGHYLAAAERQKDYLLHDAPRYANGAISHRTAVAELWSDAMSTFPPFLAYYAVQLNDTALLRETLRQIRAYRDVLRIPRGPTKGLWKHVVGPSARADAGASSVGNAWAAYGLARVRATLSGWRPSRAAMAPDIADLDRWIAEILDAAIALDGGEEASGLLRGYLGDDAWPREAAGTALLAATAYRMAVLNPARFATDHYVGWAYRKRIAVFRHIDEQGFVRPVADPLRHDSREMADSSAEAQSFVLFLGSAWRDCVCRGICMPSV